MPPVLLLIHSPATPHRARLHATLRLGHPLLVNAILLGTWSGGPTIAVSSDGHVTGGQRGRHRVATLDLATARDLLPVILESHDPEVAGLEPSDPEPSDPEPSDPESPDPLPVGPPPDRVAANTVHAAAVDRSDGQPDTATDPAGSAEKPVAHPGEDTSRDEVPGGTASNTGVVGEADAGESTSSSADHQRNSEQGESNEGGSNEGGSEQGGLCRGSERSTSRGDDTGRVADESARPRTDPTATAPPPGRDHVLSPGTASDEDDDDDAAVPRPDASGPVQGRRGSTRNGPLVRIQVLGSPMVGSSPDTDARGMRRYARELLVYLALHRGGADLPQIMEAFWPEATIRRASQRLSTEVADLRRHIRIAHGDRTVQPVINSGGRYQLNPKVVTVDLWEFATATEAATAATTRAERVTALGRAVAAHTGLLGAGIDSEWIEPYREHHRVTAVAAHLRLAHDLVSIGTSTSAGTDVGRAASIAEVAVSLDPYSDDTTRRAMRIAARSGRPDTVDELLSRLRNALHEIGEQPSPDTVALAAALRRPTDQTDSATDGPGPGTGPGTGSSTESGTGGAADESQGWGSR
ncbi:AfsR/SARP family transcriptional regulator [Virgisporangium aurantiacum]|nr:bacterial transcriptional activator domain-containing protein [Virgisporangium aurantiacum]